MIVTKTPLRVSFVGGGTDIPSWYSKGQPGAVVSAAISASIYVSVGRHWRPDRIRVSYSRTENVNGLDELQHGLVRESMRRCKFYNGIEITTVADIPGQGTGLGSSSTVTVGLLNALSKMKGRNVTPKWLAETACEIEIGKLGKRIGKQDQYAAAYGGINFMRFNQRGTVDIEPLKLSQDLRDELKKKFILYYTGIHRKASQVLDDQVERYETRKSKSELHKLSRLAVQGREALLAGNLEEFAYIVTEGWERKKILSERVTTSEIEAWMERAYDVGAFGGKICGAGGGGFILLYIKDEGIKNAVFNTLKLREVQVDYGAIGSEVVYEG